MNKQPLTKSKRYRSFVTDRDRALEKIHQNTQLDMSRMLYEALEQVENLTASLALKAEGFQSAPRLTSSFESGVQSILQSALYPKIVQRIQSMRRSVFTLTYASEVEAIAQATQIQKQIERRQFETRLHAAINAKAHDEQDLSGRVWHNLSNLRMKIVKAFSLAALQELPPKEFVDKVKSAFPKSQAYQKPPRHLKLVKEAAGPVVTPTKQDGYQGDFLDDTDWDLAVDAYKDTELPASRFDTAAQYDPDSGYAKYNWELEQEVTHDFVSQVRSGQVAAANDLGIQEFVWVAILDDKTDECCVDRNGLTTAEIEEAINSGSIDSDLCDAVTPPGHFNCRCQVVPVASVNEVEGPDWNTFGEWLAA